MDGTCARNSLECADTVFGDGGGVGADDKLLGGRRVVCETLDWEVFMIEIGVVANEIICLDLLLR
jgi:hypothetical protein